MKLSLCAALAASAGVLSGMFGCQPPPPPPPPKPVFKPIGHVIKDPKKLELERYKTWRATVELAKQGFANYEFGGSAVLNDICAYFPFGVGNVVCFQIDSLEQTEADKLRFGQAVHATLTLVALKFAINPGGSSASRPAFPREADRQKENCRTSSGKVCGSPFPQMNSPR